MIRILRRAFRDTWERVDRDVRFALICVLIGFFFGVAFMTILLHLGGA